MTITKAEVLLMDYAAILAAIKNPETGPAVQKLLTDRQVASYVSDKMLQHKQALDARETAAAVIAGTIPPSTEELADQANAMVEEPLETVTPVEAPVVSDTAAEDAEYSESGIIPYRDASGKIFKLVQEYQVRDEDGTAIGRPTHLEAKNVLELMGKQRKAHEEAVRFGYRMKKQKLQFKSNEKPTLSPEVIQEAARMALAEQDPAKATDVVREIIRGDFEKRENEIRNRQAEADGRALALEFKARHLHDFYDCQANSAALQEGIKEALTTNPDLEITLDALEVILLDLQDRGKLVPVPNRTAQIRVVPAANPVATTSPENPAAVIPAPPVVPVETVPVANAAPTAISQPAATATVTTPATAANTTPPARRPAVNGGVAPGSLSAQRPSGQALPQTRKEFLQYVTSLKPEVIKHKLKTDPQFVAGFKRHGIAIQ